MEKGHVSWEEHKNTHQMSRDRIKKAKAQMDLEFGKACEE